MLVLVQITPYGYGFITSIILCIALAFFIKKRQSHTKKTHQTLSIGCLAPILFFAFTYLFFIGVWTYKEAELLVGGTTYTATIDSYSSHEEDYTETRDGRSRTYKRTMYTPRVIYIDPNGIQHHATTDMSSGAIPELGAELTISVGEDPNVASIRSWVKLLFWIFSVVLSVGVIYGLIVLARR